MVRQKIASLLFAIKTGIFLELLGLIPSPAEQKPWENVDFGLQSEALEPKKPSESIHSLLLSPELGWSKPCEN